MRPEKKAIIDEMRSNISGSSYVILLNYRGMKVAQSDDLRKRLNKFGAGFHVIRNTFFERVMDELKWEQMKSALSGPSAIVIGQGDMIPVAKTLKEFSKKQSVSVINSGEFEGRAYSQADMETLVNLPSKMVLHAMLAGVLASPMRNLAGVMQQKVASLLYVLTAIKEKKSKSQS